MYTPQLISDAEYAEIRDNLGRISADSLPDEDICKLSYLQKAELEIMAQVPNYQAILDADGLLSVYLRSAVIKYTSCLLVPAIRRLIKSQNIQDYAYINLSPDEWDKVSSSLYQQAMSDLQALSGDVAFSLFGKTSPHG